DWLHWALATEDVGLRGRASLGLAQTAITACDWSMATPHAQAALDATQDATIEGNARHELARAAEGAGELKQAATIYAQALESQQARHGSNSALLLSALGNLISVLRPLRELARAESLAQRAVRIARAQCGPLHPVTATACD